MLMSYYCYILFIPMLFITNLLIMISSSWFSMWMIMEINMISFVSLIIFDKNIKSELLINYFLVQAFNSYLFLMSFILLNFNSINNMMMLIMNMAILTKLGMPPFYMWYLKIVNNLNWMNIFFMTTIQKIIPLVILNNILNYKYSMFFNFMLMMLSGLYSSIMGINQVKLKIIICYSSIIQMTWIITMMMFNEIMYINYFIVYMFISMNLMMLFSYNNLNNINEMNMIKLNNKLNYYLMNFSIFSLASLPPMFGFIMKLMVMQILSTLLPIIMLIVLIMNSLISMFFYIRLLFNTIMINSMSNKLNYKYINFINIYSYKAMMLSWFSMIMLMLFELM